MTNFKQISSQVVVGRKGGLESTIIISIIKQMDAEKEMEKVRPFFIKGLNGAIRCPEKSSSIRIQLANSSLSGRKSVIHCLTHGHRRNLGHRTDKHQFDFIIRLVTYSGHAIDILKLS